MNHTSRSWERVLDALGWNPAPCSYFDETRRSLRKTDMKIRVLIVEPGSSPAVTEIEPTLEAMQEVVGGYVELVRVGDLDLWVNEEGILEGLPLNRVIVGMPLVGPILVASSNEEGDTVGLTDTQVAQALSLFSGPQVEVFA